MIEGKTFTRILGARPGSPTLDLVGVGAHTRYFRTLPRDRGYARIVEVIGDADSILHAPLTAVTRQMESFLGEVSQPEYTGGTRTRLKLATQFASVEIVWLCESDGTVPESIESINL